MSSQGIDQLWAVLWDLAARIARLEGRMEAQDARQDRSEAELHKDKLKLRDIIPAILPALFGIGLVIMVIMGKMTITDAASHLFGR